MNRQCVSWNFNDRQLQSIISKFCGYYCIYCCVRRSTDIDMCKIVRSFTSDTGFVCWCMHTYVVVNERTRFSNNNNVLFYIQLLKLSDSSLDAPS